MGRQVTVCAVTVAEVFCAVGAAGVAAALCAHAAQETATPKIEPIAITYGRIDLLPKLDIAINPRRLLHGKHQAFTFA